MDPYDQITAPCIASRCCVPCGWQGERNCGEPFDPPQSPMVVRLAALGQRNTVPDAIAANDEQLTFVIELHLNEVIEYLAEFFFICRLIAF